MAKRFRIGFVAVVASSLLALSPPAFGKANPDNNGNAANAPGQESADNACFNVVHKQFDLELDTGGGPKDGWGAPTNCDHFFQVVGVIGNG
jgi:hypothetical protein